MNIIYNKIYRVIYENGFSWRRLFFIDVVVPRVIKFHTFLFNFSGLSQHEAHRRHTILIARGDDGRTNQQWPSLLRVVLEELKEPRQVFNTATSKVFNTHLLILLITTLTKTKSSTMNKFCSWWQSTFFHFFIIRFDIIFFFAVLCFIFL